MGAAAGVGADQHPPPQVAGQLRQRQPGHLDVLGGGVRPGVPGPQHDGQRLPGALGAVVGERGQRVMEPERLLPGRRGLLLLRVRDHDRGVDVDRDQAAVRAGRASPASAQARSRAAARAARIARSARGASAASAPTSRETTGSEATGPASSGCGAQHRDIGQAVPAQRQRHRQVGDDLPRVVHRPRRPPPGQRRDRPWPRPVTRSVSASSSTPAWDTIPVPSADTVILGRRAVFCTWKVPFGLARTGP